MEIFKPFKLYCDVGKVEATINVKGGELIDNAKGFVEAACSGCQHWTNEKVREVDQDLEAEWGPEVVNHGRVQTLQQHLVDQARFIKGVESKIVVGMCTPLGAK